jgi:hypothetical protein
MVIFNNLWIKNWIQYLSSAEKITNVLYKFKAWEIWIRIRPRGPDQHAIVIFYTLLLIFVFV